MIYLINGWDKAIVEGYNMADRSGVVIDGN